MKELFIKQLKINRPVSLSEAENLLEKQTVSNFISTVNWEEFSYQPKVSFRIGHIQNEIWLKYYVVEKYILAKETRTNGDVYKDSCVEFFISADGENYYNFEFNCIGTIHLAFGAGRGNRKFVDPEIIKKIEITSSLGSQPFEEKTGKFEWEMMIRIPKECLAYSNINSLNGLKASANFYKCGEDTSEPHYVTWNPIKTKNPDYHRPEFFGEVFFE
ncbi:hypothetical protein GM418_01705 [Maribellus comscasis]|uniref:Carbohydrate-binding domain-containing protein n=1 Tax=Maribellus comscasis TaxID=2681766 RepID=A0A6I6JQB7_9BACT|nr:carbohydrate-binding family 9-like protein [Maribellus comscasis]QGY42412.1 hypothetical protein GM418_01705 [Maribellus comscasis]